MTWNWALLGHVLYSTRRQRRAGASMSLQATGLMVLCVSVLLWLALHGVAPLRPVLVWGAVSVGGMLTMYALVRSGCTEHWRDPAMTLVQILWGVTSSAVAYVLAGEAKGLVPSVLCMTLLFAGLNLARWQVVVTVLYAWMVYGVALLVSAWHVHPLAAPLEVAHFAALCISVLGSLVLGLRLSTLRARLRRQRRELREALDENRELASRDPLTGLVNRRAMLALLQLELARSLRKPEQPMIVAQIDLDHFKQVNDTYGHAVGDLALQTFAAVARNSLRASDVLSRWGGEEFVLLMVDTDLTAAHEALNRLRSALAATPIPGVTPTLHVTASIGLTRYQPEEPLEDTLARADRALYQAKRSGRNRVVVLAAMQAAARAVHGEILVAPTPAERSASSRHDWRPTNVR